MVESLYYGSFPGDAMVKNLPANAGGTRDVGSTLGSRRSPRVGNGNPLWYSCLENSMNRGAWLATVHVVVESDTTEWLSTHIYYITEASKRHLLLCIWGTILTTTPVSAHRTAFISALDVSFLPMDPARIPSLVSLSTSVFLITVA